MENGKNRPKRTLVIPGEILNEGDLKSGKNTYRRDGKIYASQMGFKTVTSNYVNVIPLSGRYIPKPDDLVIGIIQSVSPTTWLVEINSPYFAPLHVNEVPWRVDFGDTARYLNAGDTILARIFLVDEIKRIQVTMKDQGSRKLNGGQIIEISPTKVPRVIGKGGSMISLIKQKTMCRLFVGQNGRIWIDGDPEKIRLAVNAIRFIERESHRFGLTETVERYLNKALSKKGNEEAVISEAVPASKDRPLEEKPGREFREPPPATPTHAGSKETEPTPPTSQPHTEPKVAEPTPPVTPTHAGPEPNKETVEKPEAGARPPFSAGIPVGSRILRSPLVNEGRPPETGTHLPTGSTPPGVPPPANEGIDVPGKEMEESEKPKEQVLKDEEFERMSG